MSLSGSVTRPTELRISPDGTWLCLVEQRGVVRVRTADGTASQGFASTHVLAGTTP